jgi:antitoxin component YwqK of YwqJK toxin-antitoxin module
MNRSLFLLFIVFTSVLNAQNNLTDPKLYHDVYTPENVIDSIYGITMYEKLNQRLSGDSTRNCNGYACSGFITDYYSDGTTILHKGFYEEGQLKIYKNFYPDGTVERNFKVIDLKKSKMVLYYPNGNTKSEVIYIDKEPLIWKDYYKNGNLEFEEEKHKSFLYHIKKATYFEDGKPENVLELVDKKKLIYDQTTYYPNGNIKEKGQVQFNKATFDYLKINSWTVYDETGKPIKEIIYANGSVHKEKAL